MIGGKNGKVVVIVMVALVLQQLPLFIAGQENLGHLQYTQYEDLLQTNLQGVWNNY